jgi:hypothetical protein
LVALGAGWTDGTCFALGAGWTGVSGEATPLAPLPITVAEGDIFDAVLLAIGYVKFPIPPHLFDGLAELISQAIDV